MDDIVNQFFQIFFKNTKVSRKPVVYVHGSLLYPDELGLGLRQVSIVTGWFPYNKKVSHNNRTTVAGQLAAKQFDWKHCRATEKHVKMSHDTCHMDRTNSISACDNIIRFLVFGNKLMIPSRQLDGINIDYFESITI